MVRRAAAALCALAAACASSPVADGDPAVLRGCWIERRGTETITQRWFPRDGAWQGDQLSYIPGADPDPARWRIAGGPDGYIFCQVDLAMATSPPCRPAFFGAGRARGEETDWTEVHAGPESLRLTLVTSGTRTVLFDGKRDGCD